jgi:hypothetical protein
MGFGDAVVLQFTYTSIPGLAKRLNDFEPTATKPSVMDDVELFSIFADGNGKVPNC